MSPRQAYAAFMLLAAGVFLLARRCIPKPPAVAALPRQERVALAGAAFVGGMFGAKLPFAVGGDLSSEAAWLSDGKTIATGLIGAYLAVELVKVALGIRVKTGDTFALPLALALSVGRWGCFFNGCCYGTPTSLPWGVDFGDGLRRHPIQAYESLFHLAMAVALVVFMVRGVIPNHRLQFYLIAYAAFRFVTELIRPEPVYAAGLTYYQWASAVLATSLAIQWWFEFRSRQRCRHDRDQLPHAESG
jgi:phosphatidylglycerol---prolipoprotein diacylglyceryl transferase